MTRARFRIEVSAPVMPAPPRRRWRPTMRAVGCAAAVGTSLAAYLAVLAWILWG